MGKTTENYHQIKGHCGLRRGQQRGCRTAEERISAYGSYQRGSD